MTTTASRPDEDHVALVDLVGELQRVQSDVEPLLALHTEDAVIINIAGRRLLGAAAFREAMTAAMASPLAGVRTSLEVDDIRFPTVDVAIVSATKTVHDERDDADPDALPTRGRLTYVAVRTSDGWRVASAQTTAVAAS